jgi:hypothetical protein
LARVLPSTKKDNSAGLALFQRVSCDWIARICDVVNFILNFCLAASRFTALEPASIPNRAASELLINFTESVFFANFFRNWAVVRLEVVLRFDFAMGDFLLPYNQLQLYDAVHTKIPVASRLKTQSVARMGHGRQSAILGAELRI